MCVCKCSYLSNHHHYPDQSQWFKKKKCYSCNSTCSLSPVYPRNSPINGRMYMVDTIMAGNSRYAPWLMCVNHSCNLCWWYLVWHTTIMWWLYTGRMLFSTALEKREEGGEEIYGIRNVCTHSIQQRIGHWGSQHKYLCTFEISILHCHKTLNQPANPFVS